MDAHNSHDVTAAASPRPRKRRAINACVNCRTSKVRCDGNRPCQRCQRSSAACEYFDAVKDESVIRIERLEREIQEIKRQLQNQQERYVSEVEIAPLTPYHHPLGRGERTRNAMEAGLITWDQARVWFQSFFSGIQYLVPIFCEKHDTLTSVSSRSPVLLDAIISVGCRAEEGFTSPTYRQLQSRVRDHLTKLLINTSDPTVEDIQAITLTAAYSENGFVLIALALRFAMQLGLPQVVDRIVAKGRIHPNTLTPEDIELYRLCRIWHGICNLELFFSLDGGKLPGMTLSTSPRKIRTLIAHPCRTSIDIRLLSQIELNLIRTEAYHKILQHSSPSLSLPPLILDSESHLRATVSDTAVELNLWLDEWRAIVCADTDGGEVSKSSALQNLNIQRDWAVMTLYLKAITSSGVEDVAFMSEFQRDCVRRAKEAAAGHLRNMLDCSPSPITTPTSISPSHPPTHVADTRPSPSPYLSTFTYTLSYVWAKCAVSILLVLKLSILLRDPLTTVMALLRDAHRVLEELKQVTVGHIAYFQILQTSIEKCEAALREYAARSSGGEEGAGEGEGVGHGVGGMESLRNVVGGMEGIGHGVRGIESGGMQPSPAASGRAAEDEFQGYVPSEFVFEWDFPGLNLKHMPLGWQDLFVNIDSLF